MAEVSLFNGSGVAIVDTFEVPVDGYYLLYPYVEGAGNQTVLRIQRREELATWIALREWVGGPVSNTPGDTLFVGGTDGNGLLTVAAISNIQLLHRVQLYLRHGEKVGCSTQIKSVSYVGERPMELELAVSA